MPKDSGLAKPVLGALKAVMADGTYKRIFTYWGLNAERRPRLPVHDHESADQPDERAGQLAARMRRGHRGQRET